jgi:hypothetical protein
MPKQFGEEAERVTTQEMNEVYLELNRKIGGHFCAFELALTLEEKQDHGDIDILVLLHPDQNPKPIIQSINPLKTSKNGHCHSVLYQNDLGKKVHVDLLVSSDPNLHQVKKQYYAFNDLSATIGVMAKALNFKYSCEGFFKRYHDKRNNWHDILISINLNPGLQCLGLEPKPLWIKTYNDIANYVSSSLLFDSSMYAFVLEEKDEEYKRSKQHEIWTTLAKLDKKAVLLDEDYFFKRQFQAQYSEVENKKKDIEQKAYIQSKYNGTWLIEKFGLKPGPQIGKMLKLISDSFGDLLGEVEEELIEAFVRERLEQD